MDQDQSIWEQFVGIAESPDDDIDLATTALLIAATEYPQLDIADQRKVLDSLAAGADHRFRDERHALYCINTLSEYLFDEVGFRGDEEDYYDPRNNFLNEVLSRRIGIPITLSLVCIEVGKRLDIPLVGVGMPGHFLLRHQDEQELFIDPFYRGVLLSEQECAQRMRQVTQAEIAWDSRLLAPINNRDFIARILRNLTGIYWQRQDYRRALIMMDRLVALYPRAARERRGRGLAHYQLGQHQQALDDFGFYLHAEPASHDTEAIERLVAQLQDRMGT